MKTTILSRLMSWRQRASNGDHTTVDECSLEYGDNVARVVRHIVRTGNFDSEIGRFVESAIGRLQQSLRLNRAGLIEEVAREVCLVMAGCSLATRVETLRACNEATIGVRFTS